MANLKKVAEFWQKPSESSWQFACFLHRAPRWPGGHLGVGLRAGRVFRPRPRVFRPRPTCTYTSHKLPDGQPVPVWALFLRPPAKSLGGLWRSLKILTNSSQDTWNGI